MLEPDQVSSRIQVSVEGASRAVEDVTSEYLGMTPVQKKKYFRDRAVDFENQLDTLPKQPPPPTITEPPRTPDEINALMEERSVEAVHAQQDPIPVDANPSASNRRTKHSRGRLPLVPRGL